MPGARLAMDEREEIRAGIERGEGFCLIARRRRLPTSTISREVKHNGGRGFYCASSAHRLASEKSRRPRQTVFEADPLLAAYVEERLEAKLRPFSAPTSITFPYAAASNSSRCPAASGLSPAAHHFP